MDRVELRLRCIEAASRVFEGHGVGDQGMRAWIAGAVKELAFELLDWVDDPPTHPHDPQKDTAS